MNKNNSTLLGDGSTAGGPAVVVAVKSGDIAAALRLIESGADVNAQDAMLDSAFLYSGANGFNDVVRACLAHGADLSRTNRFGGIALIPASERGHVETVRILLEAGSAVNHVNRLGWTALHEAIVLSDGGPRQQEIVRLLLEHGADPRLPDRDGVEPLALATALGYDALAEIIREALVP